MGPSNENLCLGVSEVWQWTKRMMYSKMAFHYSNLELIRLRHPTLFIEGTVALADFSTAQDLAEIASFVFGCKKECSMA